MVRLEAEEKLADRDTRCEVRGARCGVRGARCEVRQTQYNGHPLRFKLFLS